MGAGSAGCVLAARLSEEPARQVLLLEAGPDYPTVADLPPELLGAVPSGVPSGTVMVRVVRNSMALPGFGSPVILADHRLLGCPDMGSSPSQRRVIRVRRERRDLIRAPHAEGHRGEDFLELVGVVGGEKSQRAPFAWLQRGTPKAKQVPLRREFARMCGLAGADVFDGCF